MEDKVHFPSFERQLFTTRIVCAIKLCNYFRKKETNKPTDGWTNANNYITSREGGGKAEVIIFGWHHTIKSPHGGLLKDIAHLEKS